MAKVVCKFCITYSGIRGSDLAAWPEANDPSADEWLCKHIESEHHIPVRREGESRDDTQARFSREYPEAGDVRFCKCPACQAKRKILTP